VRRRSFLVGAAFVLGCDRHGAGPGSAPSSSASSAAKEPSAVPGPALALPPTAEAGAELELFRRFPALASRVPRVPLGRLPSRVESAEVLAREIGLEALLVKRDDDLADVVGGGKVRKLELLLGEARHQGKTSVVTFGGVGSNQAVATALLGRELGLSVRLCLAPQPSSSLVTANLGADAASSAAMRLFERVAIAEATVARESSASSRRDLYVIPPGGTGALGTLAFVSAGLEIAAVVGRGSMPSPVRVYVPLGLGGTACGIALGCAIGGLDTEVVAVRASNPATVTDGTLVSIVDRTIDFAVAIDPTFPRLLRSRLKLRIDGRFVGGGYGAPTREGDDAIRQARASAGWELDPVYTGKALAALIADARSDGGLRGPVLFWNTQNSRPLPHAQVPEAFRSFVRGART
jgi:D-cysteine desulfhydrase